MIQVIIATAFTGILLFSIGISILYLITKRDLAVLESDLAEVQENLARLEDSVIRDREANIRTMILISKGMEYLAADIENVESNKKFTKVNRCYLDKLEKEFDFGGVE